MSSRTVVVIGATSGIGAAVARRFADDGAHVVAAGLNAAGSPAGLASGVRVVGLDVRDEGSLTDLFAEVGDVDVLVNATGVIRRGAEFDPVVFAEVIGINLTATMRSCVAAKDGLARRHGCIINVASMLSFLGGPLVPAYTASKGGIAALTRSLAVAWAPDGIRVNAVAPGWIATELTSALRADTVQAQRILDRTPMARWGDPSDITGPVAFLAGPDAGFVTGVVLPVDGGYLAM
ncbi:MAG TPA: SDR family oxidoreductase [Actinopolymorphaceae bacterium]|jgi:NAD(P)-dependent dehydrogenase (short-subunit alcohol dehydrogenase family)